MFLADFQKGGQIALILQELYHPQQCITEQWQGEHKQTYIAIAN